MEKPYIGITGFTSREEVETLQNIIPAESGHQFMVGVLLSLNMLRGQAIFSNRDPLPGRIAEIFGNDPNTLNLIHYHSKEHKTLAQQLFEATMLGGENMHGFQLNMAWPSPWEIDHYRMRFPEKVIVLQIGRRAFAMCDNDPEAVAGKICEEYGGLTDYVLLDRSGGHNQLLDTADVRRYLLAFMCRGIAMRYVVAGGLTPHTLDTIRLLIQEFPYLSIDAEGGLRDANNMLDLFFAREYLRQASMVFNIVSA
ncbi:MAG: hypothetical protein HYT37_03620 [Candidatus Sungbacteria bacterium]|nr:hypothetical protein [Candidatus Sungbacteria bacterium]